MKRAYIIKFADWLEGLPRGRLDMADGHKCVAAYINKFEKVRSDNIYGRQTIENYFGISEEGARDIFVALNIRTRKAAAAALRYLARTGSYAGFNDHDPKFYALHKKWAA